MPLYSFNKNVKFFQFASSFPKLPTFMDFYIHDTICNTIYSIIHKPVIRTVHKIYSHYQEFILGFILAGKIEQ
jgi:hypothetical protein